MTLYGQFCPVALGAEIFAERWTPLILRELLMGARGFNDIHRGVPRISKNLLTQRLDSLRRSGIIEQVRAEGERKHTYRLTVKDAAHLMHEHSTRHLIVLDEEERPVGVVSSLDLAAALAWGIGPPEGGA